MFSWLECFGISFHSLFDVVVVVDKMKSWICCLFWWHASSGSHATPLQRMYRARFFLIAVARKLLLFVKRVGKCHIFKLCTQMRVPCEYWMCLACANAKRIQLFETWMVSYRMNEWMYAQNNRNRKRETFYTSHDSVNDKSASRYRNFCSIYFEFHFIFRHFVDWISANFLCLSLTHARDTHTLFVFFWYALFLLPQQQIILSIKSEIRFTPLAVWTRVSELALMCGLFQIEINSFLFLHSVASQRKKRYKSEIDWIVSMRCMSVLSAQWSHIIHSYNYSVLSSPGSVVFIPRSLSLPIYLHIAHTLSKVYGTYWYCMRTCSFDFNSKK